MLRFKMSRRKKNKRKEQIQGLIKNRRFSIWVSAICNFVVAVAMIIGLFVAEPIIQFNVVVGQIATETITATRDVEDVYTTNKLVQQAMDAVQNIYVKNTEKTGEVYENVGNGVQYVRYVFDSIYDEFDTWKSDRIYSLDHPGEPNPEWTEDSDELKEYNSKLEEFNRLQSYYNSIKFSDVLADEEIFGQVYTTKFWNEVNQATNFYFDTEVLRKIAYATENEVALIESNVSQIVYSKLDAGIKKDELENTMADIRELFVRMGFDAESDMMNILDAITSHVTYNVEFDVESTEEAKRIAAEAVDPVVYKKGQIIITAGQPITEAQYSLIEDLGLLESGRGEYSNYISLAAAILVLCAVCFGMMIVYRQTTISNPKNSVITALLTIISMYLYILVKSQNVYICTPLIAVMLITMLVNGRMALMVAIPLSLFAGMYTGGDFSVTFAFGVACVVCACLMRRVSTSRSKVIMVGVLSAAAEAVIVLAMEYYMTAKMEALGQNVFWILVGGILSSVSAVGLLSLFEYTFGIVTPIRLLELSNQSQPILKRLQIEASGTYHHSIIVGNMAETAANDIGADGLLARVGSYYHDIGKLVHPRMFKENQADDHNPHDDLAPEVSARIIISHVKDGLQLAHQHRVPKLLHQFIEEHHGSTVASYFYVNACKLYGEENVNIEDYKYSGKIPSTKECAIVMLADTVEAAVRSMKTHSPEEIEKMIDKLVDGKIDAGQLDNCSLTFMELAVIKHSFLTILSGTYHSRVEYPQLKGENNE